MYSFKVNGKLIDTKRDVKLLNFLRDELRLTSVKNGCSEGACGTCMVIIDGKAVKACVQKTSKLDGKEITTVEGLSEREQDVYSYAFAESGAVQCGFCTPGMVISAKALLDVNQNPTQDEIKKALRGNICRCTGYRKIIDAVMLSAKMFRENLDIDTKTSSGAVGDNMHRTDAVEKTLGKAEYCDDLYFSGMLYGAALRSKYPRAIVKSVDVSKAEKLDGITAVMTAKDVKGSLKVGHLKKDQWVLVPVGGEVSFKGDAIALIAGTSQEVVDQAKELIAVEYEVLEPVLTLEQAMSDNAPPLQGGLALLSHQHLERGDVKTALENSAHVVTRRYSTPPTEHAFLEPESAVAIPDKGGLVIYSSDQGIYATKHECAEATGLNDEQIRVVAKTVGGGFGGKEDMSVQHHAALLALHTGKTVKFTMTRNESILCHPKRHGFEMEVTSACDSEGKLTAMKATLLTDTGAYASLGGPVLQRACTHAAGPYNYQNIEIDGKAFYTNNPPNGAFRGFGVTQSCFAAECNLNLLAEKVGISAFDIRYINAIRPGEVLPNGQIADDGTALVETLDAVRPYFEKNPKAGIACALKNSGLGVGVPDVGRCNLFVSGEKVHVRSSAACIGQGVGTVLIQIVSHTTGIPKSKIVWDQPDSDITPNSGMTTASRQTVFAGEAARQAALKLKQKLETSTLAELENETFEGEYTAITDKLGSEKQNPVSHVAYGYATHLVELDEDGKLKQIVAAHDVGKAINPIMIEGQIEGGVSMSVGYTLTEDFPLENGTPTRKFGTLGLLKADQVPEIKSVIIEKNTESLAYGAKGIGEICSIPTPPAIQNAYYNFDKKFRTKLPLEDTVYSKKRG